MSRTSLLARIIAIVFALTMAAACSGSGNSGAPPASTGAPSTTAPSPTRPGSNVAVDLVFTGSIPLTARGNAGHCNLGSRGGVVVAFGFSATNADYNGIGSQGIYFNEDNGGLNVKWPASSKVAWVGDFEGHVTISPDHRGVTLDADFPRNPSHPEHLKGSITCA
jgi:hypothetical protein